MYAFGLLVKFSFYYIIFVIYFTLILSERIIVMQNYLENNENVLVGERIRAIREGFHMSREKFSEMIDISEVFLGQIERGERSLSIKTLKKIVIYTGVSSDYILFGNSENNEYTSKINRILNKCSESTLKYIYELIHSSFSFFKKIDKDL